MVFLFPIIFAPRPEGERQPQPSALTEFVMDTTVKSDFAFWTATKLARGGTGSKGVYMGLQVRTRSTTSVISSCWEAPPVNVSAAARIRVIASKAGRS